MKLVGLSFIYKEFYIALWDLFDLIAQKSRSNPSRPILVGADD